MVSVYVPPLFDMEALRGPSAGSGASRDRRGVKGLAVVAAIGIASSLGAAGWWHGHSQRVASSAPVTPSAPSPVGPAATGVPSATSAGPEETSVPATVPADSAALSAAYVARSAIASGPPAGPPTPSKPPVVAAVARPAHVASGAARPADAVSSPRPAVSVPQDMLYNPYR